MSTADIDLLGYGVAAVDEMLVMDGAPRPDAKTDIAERATMAGGICVNALAAAARLGLRCHYAGRLGRNALSELVRDGLRAESIGFSHAAADPDPEPGPSHAFIIVDRATGARTILMDKSRVRDLEPCDLPESLLARCRAIYLDAWRPRAGLHAARFASTHGIETIADFEEHDPELVRPILPFVRHLVLPRDYASVLAGEFDAIDALRALAATGRRPCTAVTLGVEGTIYMLDGDDRVRRQPAFAVRAVDTTGCGDAFHGAYVAEYLRTADVAGAVRFAAAAAALNALAVGAIAGLPRRAEVERLLARGEAA